MSVRVASERELPVEPGVVVLLPGVVVCCGGVSVGVDEEPGVGVFWATAIPATNVRLARAAVLSL